MVEGPFSWWKLREASLTPLPLSKPGINLGIQITSCAARVRARLVLVCLCPQLVRMMLIVLCTVLYCVLYCALYSGWWLEDAVTATPRLPTVTSEDSPSSPPRQLPRPRPSLQVSSQQQPWAMGVSATLFFAHDLFQATMTPRTPPSRSSGRRTSPASSTATPGPASPGRPSTLPVRKYFILCQNIFDMCI